jgi:acetyl esterase/lipase
MKAILAAAGLVAAVTLAGCGETPNEEVTTLEQTWPGVPEEQAAQIRAAGKVIDPASFDIFAPLVPPPPYDDVTLTTDVAYGSDPLQVLDIYTLNDAPEGEQRPVLVYVHGGGFTGGSKQGAYYPQSATAWAARNGMVGVNIDYRLAPAAQFPAGRDDLAAAIAWVRANIAEYGGNPDRIFLWGHSAGASHVADYVQYTEMQGPEAAGVKGALLLSPAYALEMGEEPHVYYGNDLARQTAAPAIARLGTARIPVMIGWAEYDPDMFHQFAEAARDTLCAEGASGQCPRMLYLRDHNHMTEGASIGSADQSLSGPFLQWMRGL